MKALPLQSMSIAPSPLRVSVISAREAPAMYKVVGWNCMNSRSCKTAPARYAIASPSAVAQSGFVVSLYSWPAPPVARIVFAAQIIWVLVLALQPITPMQSESLLAMRSMAKKFSIILMPVNWRTFFMSDSEMTLPVESPWACATRACAWPPSKVTAIWSSVVSNSVPQSSSCLISSGPCVMTWVTIFGSLMPQPVLMVSAMCESKLSSGARTEAMPP